MAFTPQNTSTGVVYTNVVAGNGSGDALTTSSLAQFASTTSAELAGVISDETGSGLLVFGTTPTLTTPVLGAATATTINKVTITAPAAAAILTIANNKTLTCSNTLTFTGTDTSSVAFGAGGTVAYTGTDLSQFASTTSLVLKTLISDETGSGALVFANTPTLVTPVLGVASATSLATSAASPLLLTNGQLATIALTSQTVGGTTLTIPNFASVSDTFAFITLAQTFTNKRISPRSLSAASYTTNTGSSLNGDTQDIFLVTAQAGAIKFNNPSGTPTEGQKLWLSITDNGTARAITWDTAFEASTIPLPTTTVISTRMDMGFVWNVTSSKWRLVSVV